MSDDESVPASAGRLQRLEESLAFAEHALEQLSGQMAALQKRHEELERRLRRLESMPASPPDPAGGSTDADEPAG